MTDYFDETTLHEVRKEPEYNVFFELVPANKFTSFVDEIGVNQNGRTETLMIS